MILKDGKVLYYGQGEKTEASTNSDGTANGTAQFTLPDEIANGEYTLYVFNEQINGDYKTDYSSAFKTVTLNVLPKATITTDPSAKTELVFNNEDQKLIDIAGTSSEGTVKYSLSENGTYTANIPTGKNADTYTVWYYVEGDTDHADSDKASVKVTISQKEITTDNTTITLGDSLTYNGTEQTQTISSVTVDGLTLTDTDYTVSNNTGTGAKDDYVLTITGKGNFTGTATTNFAIAKADSSVMTPPTKAENLVYTGEGLSLIIKDGTADGGTIKYSVDGENFDYAFANIPKVINAKDDYKVWYKVVGDNNHNDTTAVCIEIKVASKPINTAITLTAPAKNATPQTSIETDEYTATVVWSPEIAEGGSFAKSTEYTATITVTPKANYTTDGIGENGYTLDGATSVTNVADLNVITAVFPKTAGSSGGGISTSRYTIKFNTDGGSTITSQTVTKNSKATKPKVPTKDGYIFDGWYTDSEFTAEYDFDTKITKNITLYAKWVEDEIGEPSDDKKDDDNKPSTSEWKNPFTDVKENDWFFDNVKYANENGLMSGITNSTFAPNDTLTRGMLVTILYRLEGEPAVNKSIPFSDVKADMYYANAVIWAQQNSIVSGVSENEFAPDENITREQIAAIFYRYAKFKGYDVSVGEDTNILSYSDYDEISEYAIESMQYAVGSGLIKGKSETTLNPKDFATRAEIAAILNRFIERNK